MRAFELDLALGRESAGIPLDPPERYSGSRAAIANLRCSISLKQAGDMGRSGDRENPNRVRYLRNLGVGQLRRVYSCRQVHSRKVVILAGQDPEGVSRKEADGLITNLRDAVLTVTVADCLPICLVDWEHRAFALLHSGWQGTGIVVDALEQMRREYGSRPSRISASIGPGIGSCCYGVHEDRYRRFRDRFGPESVRRGGGKYFLDLKAANIRLLSLWGVEAVAACDDCTACTPQLASYRRDGPAFDHMLACVGVTGDE